MFQDLSACDAYRDDVLNNMYHIIGSSINKGVYSFCGGYVLSRKVLKGMRSTNDIDINILNHSTFDLIMSPLRDYIEGLKQKGLIWDYIIKEPRIKGDRNVSGGVKLYVKKNFNSPKVVFCGVDMCIKQVDKGIELSPEGYTQYCNESMLVDKISVLYSSREAIIRRIRDVLDIYYILLISRGVLDKNFILNELLNRGILIKKHSTFEIIVDNEICNLLSKISDLVYRSDRVDSKAFEGSGCSILSIVESVINFLYFLRL